MGYEASSLIGLEDKIAENIAKILHKAARERWPHTKLMKKHRGYSFMVEYEADGDHFTARVTVDLLSGSW